MLNRSSQSTNWGKPQRKHETDCVAFEKLMDDAVNLPYWKPAKANCH